jgi:hypothetical protein
MGRRDSRIFHAQHWLVHQLIRVFGIITHAIGKDFVKESRIFVVEKGFFYFCLWDKFLMFSIDAFQYVLIALLVFQQRRNGKSWIFAADIGKLSLEGRGIVIDGLI